MPRGPKPQTLPAIRALLKEEPGLTTAQVAARLGVTRQRVHQVVGKAGIELRSGRGYALEDAKSGWEQIIDWLCAHPEHALVVTQGKGGYVATIVPR